MYILIDGNLTEQLAGYPQQSLKTQLSHSSEKSYPCVMCVCVCLCVHACLNVCVCLHLPVGLTVVMVDFSGVVGVVFCVVILVVGTVDGGA